ncbi:hypothetical protein [Streptomyces capillispiralis]|uniref:Uncharacterized protein n=1 Tax=Streptomyces capillispiralis TaxID=68182 RepID=A0A561TF27_9ACTN|nr:hypothetical protein [Streptomyces capillispiralis]TWF85716.1 hypothetical protein FHX78_112669 [Streptomyces capillispiralis]GHH89866.1 hypothetical protein GCM10017779_03230 [Streptomyces capillispiralis]
MWERFVHDSERAIRASAPKEPSARARMVTERLRAMDEARAAGARGGGKWRRGGKRAPAPPARPEGWRTGPARQDDSGRGARRRRVLSAVGVVLAAALAVVAVNPSAALSWLPGGFGEGSGPSDGAQASSAAPQAPETARPSAAPPAAPAGVPTRGEPFAGSPAARWEAGADAIRLPGAKAVNGVPAARIEAALKGTKEFLVASNLDRGVLEGARPRKALDLVDPAQADYLADLRAGLREPTEKNDPVWTFTRFDPEEVELVGDVRVRGHMTVEARRGSAGKAVIKADYTFVYPVARAGGGDAGDEVTRAIVRRSIEVEAMGPARFRFEEGHIWVVATDSEIANDDCREGDGVIRPRFFADRRTGPEPSGQARDPYDRSRELTGAEGDDECGVVTRT